MRHSIPLAQALRSIRLQFKLLCALAFVVSSICGPLVANAEVPVDPSIKPATARHAHEKPGTPPQALRATQASTIKIIQTSHLQSTAPVRPAPASTAESNATTSTLKLVPSPRLQPTPKPQKASVPVEGSTRGTAKKISVPQRQPSPPAARRAEAKTSSDNSPRLTPTRTIATRKREIDYRIRPAANIQFRKQRLRPRVEVLNSADEAARLARQLGRRIRQANYQVPTDGGSQAPLQRAAAGQLPSAQTAATLEDPCKVARQEKKLFELGIEISMPPGDIPTDFAAACWDSSLPGAPIATMRCWPASTYEWDATCFCHKPLYFEEINLERYGYGCGACLQPAASAAHFFGTVPALPYLIAVDCPCECIYTLGHYRPGSCPPLRYHWPPCDPIAAAAEGGVLTGLIFLIP